MEVSECRLPWSWSPKKRSRDILDVFFEEGDRFCCYSSKQVSVELEEEVEYTMMPDFPCCIAGCPETFNTVIGYESHYNSVHRHTCSECRRYFPSNHLLELHLQESHDPLFQLRDGNKFLCLLQGCDGKFPSTKSRRNHMINIHKYPASYRFDRTKQPKAGRSKSQQMEVTQAEKENTAPPVRRVYNYKVPQSICFGQGSARGFHRPRGGRKAKHWHQSNMDTDTTVDIESVNMEELKDALG